MIENLTNINFWLCIVLMASQELLVTWMYGRCFEIRKPKWLFAAIFVLTSCILQVVSYIFGGLWLDLKPITHSAALIAVVLIFVKERKLMSVLFYFINVVIDTIIEILMVTVWTMADPLVTEKSGYIIFTEVRVELTIALTLITIPFKYIFVKIWNRISGKGRSSSANISFILFPLAQMIVLFCVMLDKEFTLLDSAWSLMLTMLGFTLICVSDIIFFYFITEIENKREYERELKYVKYVQNEESKQYEILEKNQYETAKIRHDINNMLMSVRRLIDEGNGSEADEMLSGIEKQLEATKTFEYCSIPSVNAIISEKSDMCRKNEIEFSAYISVNNIDGISKNHFCSIFSNLLDNAIKENLLIEDKSRRNILINAGKDDKLIVIRCINSVSDEKKAMHNIKHSKGYGLKILNDIAKQYGGRFEIKVSESKAEATVILSIQ